MRNITEIIVHCSATPEGKDITAADIDRMHKDRGFKKWFLSKLYHIGYHYIVRLDGTVEKGRPDECIGAHVRGHNTNSIGICYIGGMTSDMKKAKDTRTPEQKESLLILLRNLRKRYPNAVIKGHRDCSPDTNHNGKVDKWEWLKECPCFNAMDEYKDI